MQFKFLTTTHLHLQLQLQWLWYSSGTSSFITGDDRRAFALPVAAPCNPSPMTPARPYDDRIPPRHPCNLPVPMSVYDELAAESWHGFQFLPPSAYPINADGSALAEGDMLRTLVFGPNYGDYLLHPASGLVVSLRSGAMELLQRSSSEFKSIDKTRTRGSAALAFAAHPREALIVYGDNAGKFHAHQFSPSGFGKAAKIADRQRKASRVEFIHSGTTLVIGGMGYLATYSHTSGKFASLHEVSIPVRDFVCTPDGNRILVNQGLHGVTGYQYDQTGFVKIGALEPPAPVREIALSRCGSYLAILMADVPDVNVYEILEN